MNKQINFIIRKLIKSIEHSIFIVLTLLFFLVILQIFFFSTFKIPSDSMSRTLEAGDNGENSQDSRYWGLLPEEYIVGKAWIVWKSIDPYTGKIRWERLFNPVN